MVLTVNHTVLQVSSDFQSQFMNINYNVITFTPTHSSTISNTCTNSKITPSEASHTFLWCFLPLCFLPMAVTDYYLGLVSKHWQTWTKTFLACSIRHFDSSCALSLGCQQFFQKRILIKEPADLCNVGFRLLQSPSHGLIFCDSGDGRLPFSLFFFVSCLYIVSLPKN